MRKKMFFTLILALVAMAANAQNDGFDPTPPGDPNYMYKVKVVATPVEAGYTSGGGYYVEGSRPYVSTSARTGYIFKHWLKDGEEYSSNTGFYFTVEEADVVLTAVYEREPYEPPLPGDPNTPIDVSRLYLKCEPSDGGSFNKDSGIRYNVDTWVTLTAYVNQGFVFKGWYDENNTLLSENTSFNYLTGASNTTLTARYEYAPSLPDDPGSTGQDNVDNSVSADITGDGEIDVQDVVTCINMVLSGSTDRKGDISNDGVIDVQDVVTLINIILKNN